jgi:hypothetical protein
MNDRLSMPGAMPADRAEVLSYSAQAALFIANTEAEHPPTQFLAYAMQAGAFRSRMCHFAEKADAEAANTARICRSLTEYERAAPRRAIEWDEAHDFLDFMLAGLEMRYDDSDEMQDVCAAMKQLQKSLCELESMRTSADSLAAHTDALIKKQKEAA